MTPDAHPSGRIPGRLTHRRPLATPPRSAASLGEDAPAGNALVIDCDSCSMRGHGCGDCMVTVLLGGPPYGVALDDTERRAIDALAGAGLIPPLRMVQAVDPPPRGSPGET